MANKKNGALHECTCDSRRSRIPLFILGILLFSLSVAEPSQATPLKVGDEVPNAFLATLEGGTFDTANMKGKFIYLDFWASWCPPCRPSLPFMNTLQDEFSSQYFMVLAVSIDDDDQSASRTIKGIDPKYTVVRDVDKTFIGKFDPPKMPSSYLIDPDGRIVLIHEGFSAGDEKELVLKIKQMIEQKVSQGKML